MSQKLEYYIIFHSSILNCASELLNGADSVKEAEDGSRGVLLADLGGSIQVQYSSHLYLLLIDREVIILITIQWNVRYKPDLGKIGQFIQSDEVLQSAFKMLRFQDHPAHPLVRFRSEGNATTENTDGNVLPFLAMPPGLLEDNMPHDYNGEVLTLQRSEALESIVRAAEPQSPRYPSLNQTALAKMQSILEGAYDANPPLSAKSSTLAILMNWAAEFRDILGPFEAWVRSHGGPTFRFHPVGPGNNFVSFHPVGNQANAEAWALLGTGSVYQPRITTPPLPPLQVLGVLPGDFFNIPIGADVGMAELNYRRGCMQFFNLLSQLATEGLLCDSLSYGSQPFELLEWYGDAVLHLELSTMLVDSVGAFGGPAVLSAQRQNGEQNLTLALIFDEIGLARLLTRCPPNWSGDRWKVKADIVEAIIGELADKLRRPDGIPNGHPRRSAAERVIRMFAQCLNTRGQVIKSEHQRRVLEQAALAPGGGGLRTTEWDVAATSRCR